jgi:hypothetical protein
MGNFNRLEMIRLEKQFRTVVSKAGLSSARNSIDKVLGHPLLLSEMLVGAPTLATYDQATLAAEWDPSNGTTIQLRAAFADIFKLDMI